MILWGLQLSLIGEVAKYTSSYVIALAFEGVNVMACGLVILLSKEMDFHLNYGRRVNWALAIVGIGIGCGTLFSAVAYSTVNAGLVAGVMSASPLVSVIIGRVFLKEHLNKQQYLGVAVLIAGVMSLAVL
jgi:drug/metabolite transporter (DMT)-like permease